MGKNIDDFFYNLDRKLFLDEEYKKYSNCDNPLPIGYGQTISQPSLVLEMTKLLEPDKACNILEIGTGSGYQTALLAEFFNTVYTVERIENLSMNARRILSELGYTNIQYKIGDGSEGWEEHAPFDRIVVTAAAGKFPTELFNQLSYGGILQIPIGSRWLQELQIIRKDENGIADIKTVMMVRFVEFQGKYGHSI